MLRNTRLVKHDGALWRNTGSNQAGRHFAGALPQLVRILRHRYGVQINNTIDRFKTVLQLHPVTNGAKIIAKMQIACRLNTGKNPAAYVAMLHAGGGHDLMFLRCVTACEPHVSRVYDCCWLRGQALPAITL